MEAALAYAQETRQTQAVTLLSFPAHFRVGKFLASSVLGTFEDQYTGPLKTPYRHGASLVALETDTIGHLTWLTYISPLRTLVVVCFDDP